MGKFHDDLMPEYGDKLLLFLVEKKFDKFEKMAQKHAKFFEGGLSWDDPSIFIWFFIFQQNRLIQGSWNQPIRPK